MSPTPTIKGTLAAAIASLASLLVPAPALAAGGGYVVDECDAVGGLNSEHAGANYSGGSNFQKAGDCTQSANDYAMTINDAGGPVGNGQGATWTWTAPPGEGIIAVTLDASLRNDNGFHARVYLANSSGVPSHIFGEGDAAGGWQAGYTSGFVSPQPRFVAELYCAASSCAASSLAHTEIRHIHIAVGDYGDPTLQDVGGELVGGGWLRGTQGVSAEGVDGQSGMATTSATVNGTAVAWAGGTCQTVAGGSMATQFDPCSSPLTASGEADTSAAPFHDGANTVHVCATDYAGNSTCHDYTAEVDNTPPQVAFANAQDPRDPELIQAPASDATSGVAGGTIYLRPAGGSEWQPLSTQLASGALQARVNSEGYPPGEYEFMAGAQDAAGNQASATTRQDGSAMTLTFPLKAATKIRGHLQPGASKRLHLGYGRDAGVSGRLTLAKGAPLRRRRVVIVENFAPGSIVAHRRFTVKTKKSRRFHAKLPPGPSRGVDVAFAGNPRYGGSLAKTGRMLVRSKATFSTSSKRVEAGKRVDFHGRVLHYGARIPSAGKLIELQVKEGTSQWTTVQQAIHTNSAGRYHLHHRFGSFYKSNVRYRFRAKIDHEADWPYKAPVRSRARTVTVIAHR